MDYSNVDHNQETHGHHQVASVRAYLLNFAGLMILLVLTVLVAYLDLGAIGKPLTLLIAVSKAALILLFFMHLRNSTGLVWVFGTMGFFFLIIMFIIAMGDYVARETIQGDQQLLGLITTLQAFIG
ncbi:MAG TPA: cytochrome C oxidase subunit IV family protein [Anaerolineae bacterium]|nr:cytochrome C oxidase subunit IV family protein [Anaerolineae bacterium]HMR62783.1 cytochrome C oxidase subunit IV family protein [Anaerolineae bacterium]